MAGASGSYDSDTYQLPEGLVSVKIKDEPDDRSIGDEDDDESVLSPAAAGVSPIDMETQEKIKLERKRLRNRQAAAKCRKRKLERISLLHHQPALGRHLPIQPEQTLHPAVGLDLVPPDLQQPGPLPPG